MTFPFRRKGLALALALLAAGAATSPVSAADDISGTWVTDDGEGAVEIRPCGARRCGRIVWLKSPRGDDGRPVTDLNNPNPGLRSRQVCGLEILSGLEAQKDGGWDGGRIYDPEEGKTYDVAIRREGPETIKVTGYLGTKALGETMVWRRAPANLGSCRGTESRSPKR